MSQSVTGPVNSEQAVTQVPQVLVAPAGSLEANVGFNPLYAGQQTLIYAAAADDAGVDAALTAATDNVLTGLGRGAHFNVPLSQPAAASWVAAIAVSEELQSVPTSPGIADAFVKRSSNVTIGGEELHVYTADGTSGEEDAQVEVNLGGFGLWTPIGWANRCDVSDGGVTVTHEQTTNMVTCGGSPGITKIIRTQDVLKFGFDLQDATSASYGLVLEQDVQHSSDTALIGTRSIELERPEIMRRWAVLLHFPGSSPYVDNSAGGGGNWHIFCPYMSQTGNPTPAYTKGSPALLNVEFTAIEDRSPNRESRYGRITWQDRPFTPLPATS